MAGTVKRAILVAGALLVLGQSQVWAQETEPLAMRVILEWSVAGTVGGAVLGAMFWLTDPGNPNNSFSRQAIEGSAIGTVIGFGFGIYVLQKSAIFPVQFVQHNPLDPSNRLVADPVAAQERLTLFSSSAIGGGGGSLVGGGGGGLGRMFQMPVFNFKF